MLDTECNTKVFVKETYIWNKLDHANIIKLYGFIQENGTPSLILEWAPNGTVIEYLKKNPMRDRAELVGAPDWACSDTT